MVEIFTSITPGTGCAETGILLGLGGPKMACGLPAGIWKLVVLKD